MTGQSDPLKTDNPPLLQQRLWVIALSFGVGAALMAAKFYVYRLTGSAAVLSDALESIINVVASAFALISIWLAAKPPDASHPYGHGKIEYFSAGFEGALIILASLGIFKAGLTRILEPQAISRLGVGLLILAAAAAVNLLLGILLVRTGRQTRSLALVADGRHLLTDVYTSAGVLAGLGLVKLTGWLWLDGVVACLVGLYILYSGGKLVGESVSGLMDRYDPAVLDEIADLLIAHRRPAWIDIHRLRVMRAGSRVNVDFHLILPRELSLEEAHRETKDLEHLILQHFQGDANVLIHMDPCDDGECPICSQKMCDLRLEEMHAHIPWTRDTLTQSNAVKQAGE
jgi:cation diffusion facilitator family transporter